MSTVNTFDENDSVNRPSRLDKHVIYHNAGKDIFDDRNGVFDIAIDVISNDKLKPKLRAFYYCNGHFSEERDNGLYATQTIEHFRPRIENSQSGKGFHGLRVPIAADRLHKISFWQSRTAGEQRYFVLSKVGVLADQWIEGTKYASSTRDIKDHPAFRKLVEAGEPALQLALEKMRTNDLRVQWFILAKIISKVDPSPPEARGRLREMAGYWLNWAAQRQHVD